MTVLRASPAGTSGPAEAREAVAADVFPAARTRRRDVVVGLIAVPVLAALSLLRQGGISPLRTLWAEDGGVFLTEALQPYGFEVFGRAYAGYLHVVPRAVAEVATLFAIDHAAAVIAIGAALLSGAAGALIVVAASGHIGSIALRGLLGLLLVIHPVSGFENLNSVALTQWHLTATAAWVTLWRPHTWKGTALASWVLVVTVLSAPLALALAPLVLVRAVVRSGWQDRFPAIAYAVAAAVQLTTVLSHPVAAERAVGPIDLANTYAIRVLEPVLFGMAVDETIEPGHGPFLKWAAAIAVGALLLGYFRRRRGHTLTVLVLLGLSAAMFVASVHARGVAGSMNVDVVLGSRYVVVPLALVYGALAVAVDGMVPHGRSRLAVLAGVVGATVLVVAPDFRVLNERSRGPTWAGELDRAQQRCDTAGDTALVRVPPVEHGFLVRVSCARLD